jgi:hypothetical protein
MKYIIGLLLALLPVIAIGAPGDGARYTYSLFSTAPTVTTASTGDLIELPETLSTVSCEITSHPTATTAVSIYGGGGVTSNNSVTLGSSAIMSLATTGAHAYTAVSYSTRPLRYLQAIVTTPTVTNSRINVLCVGK